MGLILENLNDSAIFELTGTDGYFNAEVTYNTYTYDSTTFLSWPSSPTGYTLYTGTVTANDDGYAIPPIVLPVPFTTNGQTSTDLYVSTNGYFTLGSGDNAIRNQPDNANPATMAANPADNWLQFGLTNTDGDTQNIYYQTGTTDADRHYVKLLVYAGTFGDQTNPTSWVANFYRDEQYHWLETRVKSTVRGSAGPYNSPSVAQTASTISKVWRGNLNGQNWVYMGTGTVIP